MQGSHVEHWLNGARVVNYDNALNQGDKQRWEHGAVRFHFREKDFSVKVKGRRWDTQIGAASKAIMLFAYHYALLSLVREDYANYPGIVIVDFPLQLADGTSISDKENYLVEPFIALCESIGKSFAQFIAAGRSFENLTGAKRIELVRHAEALGGEPAADSE